MSSSILSAVENRSTELSLRNAKKRRDIVIGTAVDMTALRYQSNYRQIVAREFDACVAENAFKQYEVWMGPETYDFTETDRLVEFAQDNNMALRGHTLIWHQGVPQWLLKGRFAPEAVKQVLQQYIHTFVSRYRSQICAWDVVNEAIADDMDPQDTPGLRTDSFWYQTLGPDYIALAFQWAHAADPQAKLYYNDYEAEVIGRKSDLVYALVKRLREQSIPIHGVGLQGHMELGWNRAQAMRPNVRRLVALGLEWQITEADIRIPLQDGEATQEQLERQANEYAELLEVCQGERGCTGFLVWGASDAHSWIPGFRPGWGASLLLDGKLSTKPAYEAVRTVLQQD